MRFQKEIDQQGVERFGGIADSPFSWHLLRLDNAVMPEMTAFFYFELILFVHSW
jgi:hypothetical protein